MLHRIEVPGLVIHAEDDPFIPAEPFRSIAFPSAIGIGIDPFMEGIWAI